MRILKSMLVWLWCLSSLFGAKVTLEHWKKGETFSEYLRAKGVSSKVLEDISKDDIEFLSDIQSDQLFYELKDQKGRLQQALIPIGEEMQIRLARVHGASAYHFDIIPIICEEEEYVATVEIHKNLHSDVKEALNSPALADKMAQLFKGSVDSTKFHKGDKVSFLYTQKTRLGQPSTMPTVKIARFESSDTSQFIYADDEGYGYTSAQSRQSYTVTSRERVHYTRAVSSHLKESRFGMPLRHIRVTSSFSHRRWHPILHRYRPHHGTDFGARRGTPLLAVNNGKVTFAGRMGGYGKVVKIRHKGGYESLYAHQSRLRVKWGERVKKGEIIGYVGSTGRSTGPHLHFGLKKNGRWVDPMQVLGKKSIEITQRKEATKYTKVQKTKYKTVHIKDANKNREKLLRMVAKECKPFVWPTQYQLSMRISDHEWYNKF